MTFRCLTIALLSILMLACGCVSAQRREASRAVQDYYAGDPQRAIERLQPLAQRTDQDFVLNNLRLGSAALMDYRLDEAEAAFLRAYEVLNSYGVNKGGRTVGAVLVDEGVKIWKGEPFERAMANFYLGLIYYMRHDYANARGAFENALFKLRDYHDNEGDSFREAESNFALAVLMLGKSWQHLGREDLARANFQRVIELRPDLRALAEYDRNAQANLLLVIDFGYGPEKVTDFDGAIAGFAPTAWEAGRIPSPNVAIDGRHLPVHDIAQPPIDLLAMAQDRKWQGIDTIRAVKSAVGTGLIIGGAYEGTKGKPDYETAAALIGAGMLLKATSQADVRQWEMLPRTVFILPLRVEPGMHDLSIDFPYAPDLRQTWRNIEVPSDGEATYYFRVQRWMNGPFDWQARVDEL